MSVFDPKWDYTGDGIVNIHDAVAAPSSVIKKAMFDYFTETGNYSTNVEPQEFHPYDFQLDLK